MSGVGFQVLGARARHYGKQVQIPRRRQRSVGMTGGGARADVGIVNETRRRYIHPFIV